MELLGYQENLVNGAKDKLRLHKQVGLDVFARGGKSYIAMELIDFLNEELGCKTFLVIAPKTIVRNLKGNLFRHYDNIIYLGKEMLSRNNKLEDLIVSIGSHPDDIDAIIFDEAHTMFGKNIGQEINSAMNYIKSKYVIAMTATPDNNLTGIRSLELLINKDCILHYKFNTALDDGVIAPLTYVPGVLKYNAECHKKLEELKSSTINKNDYIVKLYQKLENSVIKFDDDMSNVLFKHIKDKVKFDSSDGGRVFIFFNTVDKILKHKESIEKALYKLYKYWGNPNVKVNMYEYTCRNTKDDDKEIDNVIRRDPYPNNIDVILTVNRGSMGIHPSNVHFGIFMEGTYSIQRYLQLLGRITNLVAFDKHNTVFFDLRDNGSFLGRTTINAGKYQLTDRRKYKRIRALETFNGGELNFDVDNSYIKIESCDELENTIELFERILNLEVLTEDNTELFGFIKSMMHVIDGEYNGNISLFFKKFTNKYNIKKYKLFASKYEQIRKAALYKGFNERDKKEISKHLNKLGYRLYLNTATDSESIPYIKNLYNDFNGLNKTIKQNEFIKKYEYAYLTGNMTSGCYAIIQSNEKLTNKILARAYNTLTDSKYNLSKYPILASTCKNLLKNLDNLDNATSETRLETYIMYSYLSRCRVDFEIKNYVDNIVRYIDKFYSKSIHDLFLDYDLTSRRTIEKVVYIIDSYLNNDLHIYGENNKSLEKTIAMISRSSSIEDLDPVYQAALKLLKIYNIDQFNKRVVPKTYMAYLINEFSKNLDRKNLYILQSFISENELPLILIKQLKKYNSNKITYKNCSDRDIKIAINSVLTNDNKEHLKLIRNVIRKKVATNEDIIINTLSAYVNANETLAIKNFLMGKNYNKNNLVTAITKSGLTIQFLSVIKDNNVLHKKYNDKVAKLIEIANSAV